MSNDGNKTTTPKEQSPIQKKAQFMKVLGGVIIVLIVFIFLAIKVLGSENGPSGDGGQKKADASTPAETRNVQVVVHRNPVERRVTAPVAHTEVDVLGSGSVWSSWVDVPHRYSFDVFPKGKVLMQIEYLDGTTLDRIVEPGVIATLSDEERAKIALIDKLRFQSLEVSGVEVLVPMTPI